ncbi:uncharacterized protein LOC134266991 [Saccostrea cucullata]|uniref:uncharacterized protein LOC134266991 n=1 Tax=Saccostrea cuccullata TaxID=36930 RepID=UPI002ED5C58C
MSAYRPPGSTMEYALDLFNAVKEICLHYPKSIIILGGDLNTPDISWSTNSITGHQCITCKSINEHILNLENELGLNQIVDFPTRKENTLDLFFSNRPSFIDRCEPLPGISDHEAIFVSLNISISRIKPPRRRILLWKKADIEGIKNSATTYSGEFCHDFSTSSDINQMWSSFSTWCSDTMTKLVPSRMSSQRVTQPWANRDVRRLSRAKRKWFKKARISGCQFDRDNYTSLKHDQHRLCRQAYNKHISDMLSDDTGGKKKFWSFIKSRRTDMCGVSPLKKDGLTHNDSATKADVLNRQFASVFFQEAPGDLPPLGPSTIPDVPKITVSVNGVEKLLKYVNPSKATGPDNIPGKLLREASTELAPAMTLLFQASVDQGRIPDDWKSAKIAPVFKKGDRSQPSNYRPISLTSICCKIAEHIIHSSIITHLDDHKVLSDSQHGFSKTTFHRNTTHPDHK